MLQIEFVKWILGILNCGLWHCKIEKFTCILNSIGVEVYGMAQSDIITACLDCC
jgi:hypothetical protein